MQNLLKNAKHMQDQFKNNSKRMNNLFATNQNTRKTYLNQIKTYAKPI